jgi:O-antigen/teichoic acid export membrane protein
MSWAAYFVQFGNLIFVLPLVLKKFSEPEQNIWFFLNFMMGIALLADAGFGPTILRAYSYFRAGAIRIPKDKKEYEQAQGIKNIQPNYNKLKDLLTTSHRIYLIISAVVLLFLSTGGVALTMNLMEQAGNRPDLWMAYALFVAYCVISISSTRWTSAARGLDYVAYTSRINIILGVIKTITFFVLLLMGKGILWLVCFNLLEALAKFFIVRNFVLIWFHKHVGKINRMQHFDSEIFHSIWKTTWNTGLTFIALYIISYVDTIIVSQFKNSNDINRFYITKRIFTFIQGFSCAPFYANVQRIYSIGAKKDFVALRKKSAVYIFYSMAIIIGGLLGLALFGNWILSLFTETRLVTFGIYTIMALTIILQLHSSFHADIYVSTNHFPFLIPAGITGLVVGIFGIPVANHYGIFGLVLVPLAATMIVNNWYPVYLSFRLTGWNLFTYIRDLFIFGFEDLAYRFHRIVKL